MADSEAVERGARALHREFGPLLGDTPRPWSDDEWQSLSREVLDAAGLSVAEVEDRLIADVVAWMRNDLRSPFNDDVLADHLEAWHDLRKESR
ncbi:MAG: hypothetical protein ACRDJ2_13775 [Actinomycetota bacterium]